VWGNSTGVDDLTGASATYSNIGSGEVDGEGNISVDPMFVAPGNDDYHLQEGSPCIDAGNNEASNLPETDKDGNIRIAGARVDMGAYEWKSPNQPPSADAGGPYSGVTDDVLVDIDPDTLNKSSNGKWVTAYLLEDVNGTAGITLDGSGSTDPDGDELTYIWTIVDADGNIVLTEFSESPTVSLSMGEYVVELIVNDGTDDSEPDYSLITIELLDVSTLLASDLYLNGIQGEREDFQDPELMVKFDRVAVAETVEVGADVEMIISGLVFGVDYITVIDEGRGNKGK